MQCIQIIQIANAVLNKFIANNFKNILEPGALYLIIIFTCSISFTTNISTIHRINDEYADALPATKNNNQRDISLNNILHENESPHTDISGSHNVTAKPIDAMNIIINGIVVASRQDQTYVLVSEEGQQKRYKQGDTLKSNPGVRIGQINRTSVIFDNNGRMEKVMLHPKAATADSWNISSEQHYVLADVIIATPVREGDKVHGLRLQPRTGRDAFKDTLLEPGDVAIRLNNLDLTDPEKITEALSTLLTLQSVQFTVRRSGVPRLINVSVRGITGTYGKGDEGI